MSVSFLKNHRNRERLDWRRRLTANDPFVYFLQNGSGSPGPDRRLVKRLRLAEDTLFRFHGLIVSV